VRSLRKDTLKRIMEEFPTVSWGAGELDELVAPSFGVITGFQQLLSNIEALEAVDLGETPMAGSLRPAAAGR
jgi:hypothetical protein